MKKTKIPSPVLNTIQKINLIKQNNLYLTNLTKESKIKKILKKRIIIKMKEN